MITARRTPFKLRKLLVIDDDENTVRSYCDLLAPYGFEILIAHDGEQAMPLVGAHPDIQLVILDLSMPNMDGRQWLRWFRGQQHESPVIVISGYKLEPSDEDLSPAAVLEKPVEIADLLDMVGLFCGLGTPVNGARGVTV